MKRCFIIISALMLLASCNNAPKKASSSTTAEKPSVAVPVFCADSAYNYVAKQLAFGPRVPEGQAHAKCCAWLCNQLKQSADTLFVQEFKTRLYNDKTISGKNIIASFNPDARKRIVLASHWDSRPFADHDPDMKNWNTPIPGANDGASGVGILIEMARLFSQTPLREGLGVDIVLFDLEDYGIPAFDGKLYRHDSWTLGSEYWSQHPHRAGYQANLGVLLDMVGAPNPVFPKEYYSQQYAAWWGNKIWKKARELGYGEYFPSRFGQAINDDHLPMNSIAGIPTVDIIHLVDDSSNGSFYQYWHTLGDNIDQIDKNTLGMVGTVLCNVIYNE